MRKLFCILTTVILLLSVSVFAFADSDKEEKVYCTATLEDDFTDNCVLVMITNKESLNLKLHTTADFPEVKLASVQDLTPGSRKIAQIKLSGGDASELGLDDIKKAQSILDSFDPQAFHLSYRLVLEEPGKENVLKAIEALQDREDIYCAEPSYLLSISGNGSNEADDTADPANETPFPIGATIAFSILICFLIARGLFFRIRKNHVK